MDMAMAVYNIPAIPARLKGAKLAKLFKRQSGNKTDRVSPINAFSRLTFIPNVRNNALKVSPNTILYASIAKNVLIITVVPGIHAVVSPIVFSHAVR
jgi:hypothetical protein